ncbi:MAG: SDR family NAD(P)-dependent oxidoreductase [Planctomycetes bacterium]|nr:SDR family NAD(P)-dependent oxidoreductase [Planctomycetota bacterium]MBL7041369.1 SDR family NAD(P)-dependent oxidoreductase [Pirellulaceae bacterium]
MSVVLVTGAAGNIGSFIADQLIEQGHFVVIVDNFYNAKLDNIREHLHRGAAALEVCDIANYRTLQRVFAKWKPEYVSHQASMMIMDSREFPFDAIDVNIKGTFHVIQAAVEHGVRRMTFASSASVFGNPRYVPVDEEHPFDNQTLYGATKIAQEALYRSWAFRHQIPWCGFRYYNTYSERQGMGAFYTQVFQKWILLIDKGEPIQIYGDGQQTMDLIHSEDCARANVAAMFREDVANELFNVGTGIETSLNELKEMLFRKMGKSVPVEYLPDDEHLVRRRQCSTKKIRQMLGFAPRVSLEEGIERYIHHMRATD